LIGFVGRKDEGYDGIFLNERNILKRVCFDVTLSYEELKEVAHGPYIGINRVFSQFNVAPHVKEKAGLKRAPACLFLHHVSIKKKKVISYGIHGVSEALAINKELI
jgi:hypothetical protein